MGFWDRVKAQVQADLQRQQEKVLKLEYVGGLPGFKGKQIELRKFSSVKMNGKEAQLVTVSWQDQATRSLGKAAAGAIVGGVLTGGLGAIAGAAIGGRKSDNSLAVIQADIEGISCQITVRCSESEYGELSLFMPNH